MNKAYPAKLSALADIAKDVQDFCAAESVPDDCAFAINLALDELFTNSVSYGYAGAEGSVEVEILRLPRAVKITISDSAPKFNPLEQAGEPDLRSGVQDRDIGGLGVFFVKKQMDEVSYRHENGKNIITMLKNIPDARK